MNENRTYTNVEQMVRETSDDKSFADDFEKRLHGRRIVKDLMVRRATQGLSQKQLAEKLGCTQSRISKMESMTDVDLRLGDFVQYANALGFHVNIVLTRRRQTAVDRVKSLVRQIKHELDGLAKLSENDPGMASAVASFFGEAFFNLVKIIQDSARKLPCHPTHGEPFISVEIRDSMQDGEEPEDCGSTDEQGPKGPIGPLAKEAPEGLAVS